MQRRKANIVIGLLVLAFAISVYLIIPSQIPELERYDMSMGLSPALSARLATYLIALLSVIMILKSYLDKRNAAEEKEIFVDWSVAKRVLALIFIAFSYIWLIDIVGYILLTPIVLGALIFFYGQRNWLLIIVVAVVATVLIHLFFRYGMLIILPEGKILPA